MGKIIHTKTAQQIVETVKDVCGHDINFINPNGLIFASTDSNRIGDFHEIAKQVAVTGEALEVETDNSFIGSHKGVNLPFRYNGEIIAIIGITGEPQEVRKYAYLAQRITALILREHELDTQTHNKKAQINYIIHSLITNSPINHDYLLDFVEKNNLSLSCDYQTIVIQPNARYNTANLSMLEQQIYQAFSYTNSKLYTFNYPNEYVLILEKKSMKQWAYLFEKLANTYKDLLKIAIGIPASLTRQNLSYDAAKLALKSIQNEKNLIFFEDLDLEILLGSVPDNAKNHFLRRSIDKLTDKEKDLLQAYFQCNTSLKETCALLYIHKNTLQYQLDKIWHTCGYNPRNFQDAVILYLGLKL